MPDYNIKTEDAVSPRFEHKSQGMRSQSQSEKKAAEDASRQAIEAADDDKTIKIDKASYKTASASLSSQKQKAQGSSSKSASVKSDRSNLKSAESVKTSGVRSSLGSASAKKSSKSAASLTDPAKKTAAKSASASNAEGLGITVFMNRSDIPAYELGLNGDEFYVPSEIKSGKVSKISPDQLAEMEANARKKRKKSTSSKKSGKKKKMTPAQKAVRAAIWLVFWIAVFVFAFVCYRITYNVFYDMPVNPDSTSTIEYTVTADATDESVYEDLSELGVMNCTEFIYKLRAKVFDAEYVEGTYTISDGYNIEKIINILAGYNYSSDDDDE